MKKITLISIAIIFGFMSNGYGQSTSSLANIDQYILDQMEMTHKPGLAACIIKGDSVVWRGNFGYAILEDSLPVSDTTLFNACSIGKSITAACVLQLWEDGLIGLDENINNFLPFQIDNPSFDPDSITARMLMTHTSGIRDFNLYAYVTMGDPSETLSFFLENYLSSTGIYYDDGNFNGYAPGTHYEYSNFGSALNGYLVETLMGAGFKEYADENILSPLGMDRSAWFLSEINVENLAVGYEYSGGQYQPNPHYGHPAYPGVSLRSNAYELAQFVIMLLNHGNYFGNAILEPATIDSMTTLQMNLPNIGLGLYRNTLYCQAGPKTIWGHSGCGTMGYAAELQFCPDENIGVVYMSNSNNYNDNILKRLFDYAAMIVYADLASQVSDSSFFANWQMAPDADGYLLDVALDEQFTNFVSGFQNYDAGTDTIQQITGLSTNTEYFYRLRSYNVNDTGAYSNTINLTTLLGTGMENAQYESVKIWSSGKTVNISISQNPGAESKALIYSLTGRLLGSLELKEGINSIKLNMRRQPIFVKVSYKNKSFYKKIMMW